MNKYLIIFIKTPSTQPGIIYFLKLQIFNVSLISQIIGSVIIILGLITAMWARTMIGKNWSGYVSLKENHELVTNGPYNVIRHPIYTGLILMLLGTVIYYSSAFALIFLVIYICIFLWRIKKEEYLMIKTFGKKYTDYMKRTKTLIPFII